TATLNGGTLRFISTTGAEGSGGTFLTATGGLTGTFATVETVGAQLPLAVIYQPTAGLMAPSVLTARPSTFNAQSLAAADTALGFIDSLGLADQRHGRGNRVWMSGFGSWADRNASGSTLAYSHDTYGLGGGVNLAASESLTLGAALGWASGDITLASNGGRGDQSNVLGALHATWSGPGMTLGGGVVYGHISQDTVRNVSFNGFAASVAGSTSSQIYGGFAELAVPLVAGDSWSIAASGRSSYVHQSQNGYTESSDSPLRLSVGQVGTSTVEGQALVTARASLFDGAFRVDEAPGGIDLTFDLGLRYLAALGDRAIPVTFASSNAGVILQGDTRDGVQGIAGLGLSYTAANNLNVQVGYRAELGQRDNRQIRATVSLGF
ncbi:MAG: autotransporter outer membrane beta-barrel domain-containing protein, partial [Erythrobacter sp.]|nr:autotransporter outer membrane beta-barrel domain-containing protein [Erythrobacter sp.]